MKEILLPIEIQKTSLSAIECIASFQNFSHPARENYATKLFLEGNIPERLKQLQKVSIIFPNKISIGRSVTQTLTLFVTNDYLSLGTNEDFLRFPLNPLNAQKICDAWNCSLPTDKIVTIVWNASNKLPPQPWGPPYNDEMLSLKRYVEHDKRVNATISKLKYDYADLLAGHKKDVILSNRLQHRQKQVAIFGWHQANGKPIQTTSLIHENTYSDYAHGVRLVSNVCFIDNDEYHLHDILKHPELHKLLSSEGIMQVLRQPQT
jgi:hypothetical protein